MRYISILLMLLTFCPSLKAERHEPYTGSRIFWDSSTRKTIFNGAGYARVWQLQDGRLMACAESGGIVISFSSNMGNSWDGATRIVENTNNTPNCVPDLIQLADGTIIVAYNPRPSQPFTVDRKFGIRCKRSEDNGKTWSEEIFVNDAQHTFEDGCWEPSMLELPTGELHLYFADEGPYTTSGEQQISLCRSFDKGKTWTPAEKVSFRAGYRDGMPVPILLNDLSDIVVAIEDNGWSGYSPNFFPTVVRCSYEKNWPENFFVSATSSNRDKTLDPTFAPPSMCGGAPYLRQLPWGETIVSFQSTYYHGSTHSMVVGVGDNTARHFKAVAPPFMTSVSDNQLWNSLAVVDTGIVVAVAGTGGTVEMVKGYPTRLLQAPNARPTMDGKLTKNEGYYRPASTQMIIGTQTGTRVSADFCYDRDSLYFIARVSDKTQVDNDCVRLLLDVADCCDTKPQEGCYYYQFRNDGKIRFNCGRNGYWRSNGESSARLVVGKSTSYYITEVAIPWSELGCEVPPVGQRMAATVELIDYRGNLKYQETMPDAETDASWTWMEFRLQDPDPSAIKQVGMEDTKAEVRVVRNGQRLIVKCSENIASTEVFAIDGRALGQLPGAGQYASGDVPYKGMAILRLTLNTGKTVTKNIVL